MESQMNWQVLSQLLLYDRSIEDTSYGNTNPTDIAQDNNAETANDLQASNSVSNRTIPL